MASKAVFNPDTAENLADVLYEIGMDLLSKSQFQMAVKWLDRAYEVLNQQELDRLSMDASELRISIIECLVKALSALRQQEPADRAWSLVHILESEIGDKLVVLLLQLKLLANSPNESFDSIAYSDVIQRMIRTLTLSEANLKLIMLHIRKLSDRSLTHACRAIEDLLGLRVLPSETREWIEKIIVTRLWMATKQEDTLKTLTAVEEFLTSTAADLRDSIGASATLGAQVVSLPSPY